MEATSALSIDGTDEQHRSFPIKSPHLQATTLGLLPSNSLASSVPLPPPPLALLPSAPASSVSLVSQLGPRAPLCSTQQHEVQASALHASSVLLASGAAPPATLHRCPSPISLELCPVPTRVHVLSVAPSFQHSRRLSGASQLGTGSLQRGASSATAARPRSSSTLCNLSAPAASSSSSARRLRTLQG
jgi:hypothetical protein